MTTDGTRRLVAPGLLLGAGLGGFLDGIVLHQVLQWHHMVSGGRSGGSRLPTEPASTLAGLEVNTFWDGVFHAATWVVVVAGLALLWHRMRTSPGPWSTQSLLGLLLAGWGVFNVADGVVNHHLLGLHHIRTDVPNVLAYDLAFLGLGVVLTLAGAALYQDGTRPGAGKQGRGSPVGQRAHPQIGQRR